MWLTYISVHLRVDWAQIGVADKHPYIQASPIGADVFVEGEDSAIKKKFIFNFSFNPLLYYLTQGMFLTRK